MKLNLDRYVTVWIAWYFAFEMTTTFHSNMIISREAEKEGPWGTLAR